MNFVHIKTTILTNKILAVNIKNRAPSLQIETNIPSTTLIRDIQPIKDKK